MRKLSAILLAFLLILTCSFPVNATEPEETTEHPETIEYPDDPSREPDLVANSAIIMDAASGQILYEKNAHDKKYPASITKIMTTILALDKEVDFNATITMSENSIWGVERDSTLIGLDVGERVSVGDCVYATMVKSANECAYAVAEYVAGDRYIANANLNLYAVWTKGAYEVTVESQNGTVVGAGSKEYGSEVTLTVTPNPGYVFTGWEVINGGITLSSTTDTITMFTMPQKDVSIKANFEKIVYTITTIVDSGAEINGVYTNFRCEECGGTNHECEVVNIIIESGDSVVTEL